MKFKRKNCVPLNHNGKLNRGWTSQCCPLFHLLSCGLSRKTHLFTAGSKSRTRCCLAATSCFLWYHIRLDIELSKAGWSTQAPWRWRSVCLTSCIHVLTSFGLSIERAQSQWIFAAFQKTLQRAGMPRRSLLKERRCNLNHNCLTLFLLKISRYYTPWRSQAQTGGVWKNPFSPFHWFNPRFTQEGFSWGEQTGMCGRC